MNIQLLQQFPLFEELGQDTLNELSVSLKQQGYETGEIILQQGQISDRFHVIVKGQINVFVEGERRLLVATLQAGQFLGEMSCLTGNVVSATLIAESQVETVSLSREGLLMLMDKHAGFRNHMTQAMVKRIQESNNRTVEEFNRSIAVMKHLEQEQQLRYGPLVGNSMRMQQLRQEISHFTASQANLSIVGERGVGKTHIAYELHRCSERREYPFLVIAGKYFNQDEWETKLRAATGGTIVLQAAQTLPISLVNALLQASKSVHVILTADAQMKGVAMEQLIVPSLRDRKEDIEELTYCFLTALGADPQYAISEDAISMLKVFPYLDANITELKSVVEEAYVLSQHRMIARSHIRFGKHRNPGAKPRVGLALGSGAARGAAHVGVLKVLEQEGIPIDIITGTSVGAFIGALYAGGRSVSFFEELVPTISWGQLVSMTLPSKGLVHNYPMMRFVEKYIGKVNFEDLKIPFAAVAADAMTGEAIICNKGRVAHAVCASTAIPAFIKPFKLDGRFLVDGGIVHPVPVTLARSMGADLVIGVDISSSLGEEPKSFVSSILNTIEIMSRRLTAEELLLADVVIHPAVTNNQASFKLAPYNMEMGRAAATAAVDEIQHKLLHM